MLSIEAPWGTSLREWWPEDNDPEVLNPFEKAVLELECPEFGTVVEARADAGNASCPVVAVGDTGREPEPCGISLDYEDPMDIGNKATASAMEGASLATESAEPGETEDWDCEEDAAGGVGIPRGIMVAASALGWLGTAL